MAFVKRFQKSLESCCDLLAPHLSIHRLADYASPENTSSENTSNTLHYVVAYSGGVDSHVLLHCCKQLGLPVRAVHVHHGLQAIADDWVKHCQKTCDSLSVPLEIFYVDATQQQGQSPEETARNVRYEVIHKNLQAGDCLLTAQHENDQAETLLLQLFRTASAAGLAAMPACKVITSAAIAGAVHASVVHARPLLHFSRESIVEYAKQNDLHWVEDPSNQDTQINRNFIRREVLPLLQSRWPELATQLSTVAELQSNNLQVLEDMAAIDLANVTRCNAAGDGFTYKTLSQLSINGLQDLSSARILNVLRLWIIATVNKQPSRNLLSELENSLINSSQDAVAVIKFSQYEFRKFQENLYLLESCLSEHGFVPETLDWSPAQSLKIANLNLNITAFQFSENKHGTALLPNSLLGEKLTVSFRKGGERFHPAGRKHSQSLKKLLQEANIPPWERDCIPLIYFNGELIAVADLWIATTYAADAIKNGWSIKLNTVL